MAAYTSTFGRARTGLSRVGTRAPTAWSTGVQADIPRPIPSAPATLAEPQTPLGKVWSADLGAGSDGGPNPGGEGVDPGTSTGNDPGSPGGTFGGFGTPSAGSIGGAIGGALGGAIGGPIGGVAGTAIGTAIANSVFGDDPSDPGGFGSDGGSIGDGPGGPNGDAGIGVDGGTSFGARGGLITGPGTGTSDDVPLHTSNGEFLMPADVTARHLPELERMRATSATMRNNTMMDGMNDGMMGQGGGLSPQESAALRADLTPDIVAALAKLLGPKVGALLESMLGYDAEAGDEQGDIMSAPTGNVGQRSFPSQPRRPVSGLGMAGMARR